MKTETTSELRILHLEDVPSDAELVDRELRKGKFPFQSCVVDTKKNYIKALQEFSPDIILSDHSLTSFDSHEALSLLHESGLKIPFVLVTATISEEYAVEIMKNGAYDYVLKDRLQDLPKSVINAMEKCRIKNEREKYLDEIVLQNKELLKTNQELDRFVYSTSHELRAPLMSVMGLINISRCGEDNPEKLQILDMMQTSINSLDSLIKDIILTSKNSRLEVSFDKIDFKEIINENIALLHYMEEAKKININIDVLGNADFYSDKKRISVLFSNFLSNAIKYSDIAKPYSFIHIHVMITSETAYIQISDNGVGIAPVYVDKIFDMFYRANTEKVGTGLGLYIVKEVIDKISGSVRVESEEGHGTTFYVSIPNSVL